MDPAALDYAIVAVRDADLAPMSMPGRAARNLRRAFCVYEAAVQAGMDLDWLARTEGQEGTGLCKSRRKPPGERAWSAADGDAAVRLLIACVRVLMSPFGGEIAREVGRLFAAVLERVAPDAWPAFRWRAAKSLVAQCDRMYVQVGLATFGLPYLTTRSRCLQLDYAHLCLGQWCSGPAGEPRPLDVSRAQPRPDDADRLSFSLSDVTVQLESVPEMGKGTDAMWACGIGRLAKQVISDEDVLGRRAAGDVGRLVDVLKGMRRLSHRVGGGIPVQNMRLALDTTMSVLNGYAETDRRAYLELHPRERGSKAQRTIESLLEM
jgi:hypothetical protein